MVNAHLPIIFTYCSILDELHLTAKQPQNCRCSLLTHGRVYSYHWVDIILIAFAFTFVANIKKHSRCFGFVGCHCCCRHCSCCLASQRKLSRCEFHVTHTFTHAHTKPYKLNVKYKIQVCTLKRGLPHTNGAVKCWQCQKQTVYSSQYRLRITLNQKVKKK